MNDDKGPLPRAEAKEYASEFKALADATRIQIVSASGVGQSTVSHHRKILSEVRIVLVERRSGSGRAGGRAHLTATAEKETMTFLAAGCPNDPIMIYPLP
ncbi:hypothetical protein [Nonomuraea sp. NPDC049309]|uniref:hypothetical protein n=1 Tax=Nonomuraea sp. NPDC049309 TaxID=3364350 RepID=UPI00371268A3